MLTPRPQQKEEDSGDSEELEVLTTSLQDPWLKGINHQQTGTLSRPKGMIFLKDLKDAFVEILGEVVESALASMTSLFPRKACS